METTLRSDMRHLLKDIMKIDWNQRHRDNMHIFTTDAKELLQKIKTCHSNANELHSMFTAKDYNYPMLTMKVKDLTASIKNNLVSILEMNNQLQIESMAAANDSDSTTAQKLNVGEKKGELIFNSFYVYTYFKLYFTFSLCSTSRTKAQRLRRISLEAHTHETGGTRSGLESTQQYCRTSGLYHKGSHKSQQFGSAL